MGTLNLDRLFEPRHVALVGASERDGSPGRQIAGNLLAGGFDGRIGFVNPRYHSVLGEPCVKSLARLGFVPDLVLFVAPERLLRRTLAHAGALGIPAFALLSAVKDVANARRQARDFGVRLLGPFCAGVIRPHRGLNASYAGTLPRAGSLALISQSSSLAAAILDWAAPSGTGFSTVVAAGDQGDVSLPDLLDLASEDPKTRAIIIYLDRVRAVRALISALSAAARQKPVVVMKSTQYNAPWCDRVSRSGRVESSGPVLDAALARAGAVRIDSFANLFSAAQILSLGIQVRGRRVGIVSNGAAPAMLACHRAIEAGHDLEPLPEAARSRFAHAVTGPLTGRNPIVLRHDEALPAAYSAALHALADTDRFDVLLAIHVPDARHDPTAVAEATIARCSHRVPILTCWMGDASVTTARNRFVAANVATFRTPEAAVDGVGLLHRYHLGQEQLLQQAMPGTDLTRADMPQARKLVARSLEAGHRVLGPIQTRRLMSICRIDVLPLRLATTVADATVQADALGYPVALKVYSPNVTYRAAVTGTRLAIADRDSLARQFDELRTRLLELRPDAEFRGVLIEPMYEPPNARHLHLVLYRDAIFGPTLSLATGEHALAATSPRVVQLPPLTRYLIDDMLDEPSIAAYLGAYRHRDSVGREPLAHVLHQISELACEVPELHALYIDHLVVNDDRAVAIGVEVVAESAIETRRYGHLAIQPFPWQWIREQELEDGVRMVLRPVRPEDAEAIQAMIRGMSAESRYFRFMHALSELSPRMVAQFVKLDYDRQMAFVAVSPEGHIAGVSRYVIATDRQRGEFSILLADEWRGRGLATVLMQILIDHAMDQGLTRLEGDVLRENHPMHALMDRLGFRRESASRPSDVVSYARELDAA